MGSGAKIKAECDVCKKINTLTYNTYNININKYGIYTCPNKCSMIKTKITNTKRYGFESAFKNKKVQQKIKIL